MITTSDHGVDDSFAFQSSSPHSLREEQTRHRQDDDHDYNFSGIIYDETTDAAPSMDEEEYLPLRQEHDLLRPTSTRVSSVSSFPASVIHHTPTSEFSTSSSMAFYGYDQYETTTPNTQPPRDYSTGFRNPSSVRALQMRDEFEPSEFEDLTSARHRGSRLSYFSHRSSGSAPTSPSKRMSRSNNSSPQKSIPKTRLRKEFPLVLLHCTLLPPALSLRATQLSDGILEAIIPQPYSRRWKALHEKVVRNTEVKTRGILIPHPRDEYELLEDKLLETLELERPRLRDGHFLATDEKFGATDSGFESASSSDRAEDEDTVPQPDPCPDCGKCVSCDVDAQRKWEIKVYAANGLLRSSAWSAAWQEMEKVDVEVSVWMPEDVKREIDARIEVILEQQKIDKKIRRRERKQADDERMKEIYGSELPKPEDMAQDRTQDQIDGLFDDRHEPVSTPATSKQHEKRRPSSTRSVQSTPLEQTTQLPNHPKKTNIPLQEVFINYVRLLAQDRRNIAILLLSMLVLFYGMNQPSQLSPSHILPSGNMISKSTPPNHHEEITTSQVMTTSTSTIATRNTNTCIHTTSTSTSTKQEEQSEPIHYTPKATSSIISMIESIIATASPLQMLSNLPSHIHSEFVHNLNIPPSDPANKVLPDEISSAFHMLHAGEGSSSTNQDTSKNPLMVLTSPAGLQQCRMNNNNT